MIRSKKHGKLQHHRRLKICERELFMSPIVGEGQMEVMSTERTANPRKYCQ